MDMLSHKIRPARGLPTLLSQKKRWTAKPEDVGCQLPTTEGRGLVETERSSYQNFYNVRVD